MFHIARAFVATLCVLFTFPAVAAERYPDRPIRVIVPFAPGGGSDIVARVLTEPMSAALGTTMVVDNRAGAGSMIGCDIAAKSAPDGYTLLVASSSTTVNAAVYKRVPYDVERDLIAITRVSDQPSILVVHPSFPAQTFSDFVALARSQPGKLTFGTPGYGTATHLASEQLWQKIGANLVQVPFKGTGPALTALLSHEITVIMSTFASALPHVKQGRLRAYAVTSQKRADPLPEVPTVAEVGVEGYDYATWYGMFAPTGTPQAIVNIVHKAAVDALKSQRVLQIFGNEGMTATPTTPEQFASYIASEKRKWTEVMQFAKIEPR